MINNEIEYVLIGRTEPHCPYCYLLRRYLDEKQIDYTYIDIEETGMREWFQKEGLKTVPQFFHRGSRIGGYEQTVVYMNGVTNAKES